MERFYETEGYEAGSNVLRMVGYFSLVGLLRVHTLVGDYGGALAALAPIHPFQRTHLFTPKIAGAPQWVGWGPIYYFADDEVSAELAIEPIPVSHCQGPAVCFGALMNHMLFNAGCNIALYYYSGFCYLQLRRYTDAARAFNSVLTYIARCGVLQWYWRLAFT